MDLATKIREHVLLLDGGMGSMIQTYGLREIDFRGREFIKHPHPLAGLNDLLNLTKPSLIKQIHKEYLSAGADIITTNSFNANSVSLRDYGLDTVAGFVKRLNKKAAQIAKEAVEEYLKNNSDKDCFIAGSVGPTNRSASLSPDISTPEKRNITYDELYNAYREQIEGLIEGGVDIILFETFYDTLNLKAGIDAANSVFDYLSKNVPIMVSATVADKTGHLLSGQSLAAFVTSIDDYENVISIGLNCGFGPDELKGFLKEISLNSTHYISCHPNAGLPDEMGCYKVTPAKFRHSISLLLQEGRVNIIGGCCGTTPTHIAEVKKIISTSKPYIPKKNHDKDILELSGNEILKWSPKDGLLIVGERCNVAGSRKFLRLIKEKKIEEAALIAKEEIDSGARIIDINMDDPLLDTEKEMVRFIRYISSEPDIVKVPYMIDSSKWEVFESALKNIQGKGIVNSLSLKEGEKNFIEKALKVKELGFSLIVMAFDEKGQADSYERKIEICKRAYDLLIKKCGFHPEDIIFDVNVMAIATGMREHAFYAIDFIRAVKWIKNNLPGAKTSGGISNLSFSFRGKNRIREIIHSVFLHNALSAGLDMAIVNPSSMIDYSDIPPDIRDIVEDVIMTGNAESESKLLSLVLEEGEQIKENRNQGSIQSQNVEERLKDNIMQGNLHTLKANIEEALQKLGDPLQIIDGPLMEGMKRVGELFGEGKMLLPQVIKTARIMNEAVTLLKPYLEKLSQKETTKAGKILIATVKGDVHDIGKNIVSTVLGCNNFDVIDLGVMVPSEKIISKIKEESPDILCLSGLITPSLSEMIYVIEALERENINIPVMVGGAATSPLHTLLKIKPRYSGIVLHMADASQNPVSAKRLLNIPERKLYEKELEQKNKEILSRYNKERLIPFEEALKLGKNNHRPYEAKVPNLPLSSPKTIKIDLKDVMPFINWKMFFNAWKISGEFLATFPFSLDPSQVENWKKTVSPSNILKANEALELYTVANEILIEIQNNENFDGKAAIRFEKVWSDELNFYCQDKILPMLRQQRDDSNYLSCVDFINKEFESEDYIGFFAVTAGKIWREICSRYERKGDSYRSLIIQSISDRIAEAISEWLHWKVRTDYWGYAANENLSISEILKGIYQGVRPAWGYPMLPDQTMIFQAADLLPFEEIGITLTENGAMNPSASVSGIYISNPKSHYFLIGEIGKDQLLNYAERRNIPLNRMKDVLRQ